MIKNTASKPPEILIVDDEEAQMKALCSTLREEGYNTTGFASAKQALAELGSSKFDLLLTDLMMPEMDGIEFVRAAMKVDDRLVAIMMTAHGTINTAVEAMQAGAYDYILKPFKLSAVLPVLSRALTVRKLRLENAELERGIHQRTAELEAANQELEAFSYSVSHDLRAPLRHIDGFVKLLLETDKSKLDEKDRHYLDTIARSARQMNDLIEDLLAFSRASHGDMRDREVDFEKMIQEIIREQAGEIKERKVDWKIDPLPQVRGDPSLLRMALVNLISNALKYSRKRSPAQIEIACEPRGDDYCFRVRDNGVGFDMKHVDRLFRVFQRLHQAEEFEGTGIGLANVQRIIQRHKGKAWAEGAVDQGATFYFTLPKASKS